MQHNNSFIDLVNDAKSRIQECTVNDIQEMNESNALDGLLIDTREESEFANGCIPNAIHISKGLIECRIEQMIPNKNQKMYFYCGGGFRSALVADLLQDMGYTNTISIDGGWHAWNMNNCPISKPEDFYPTEYARLIAEAHEKVPEITATEIKTMFDGNTLDGVVIDVREDYEFAQSHIAGSTHLSKGQIEVKIGVLVPNKEQKLYLYCGIGYRSLLAGVNLQKMGYTNVYSMAGGIKEGWIANGFPVTQ